MNEPKDGGPAFPVKYYSMPPGMTHHFYAAVAAMQVLIDDIRVYSPGKVRELAKEAFDIADALIAKKKKREGE